MPIRIPLVIVCLLATALPAQTSTPQVRGPQEIHDVMKRVMDFQVKAYGDRASIGWEAAPFWAGVLAAHRATGDQAFYNAAKAWGQQAGWKISQRYFHADDVSVGQAYEEMYLVEKDPQMIADLKGKLEQYLSKQSVTNREVAHGPATQPWSGRTVWWWCDSLFMAPPALARMYSITGDKRYLDLLHSMWWDTTAYLFDQSESLYFRDDSYFFDKRKSPSGAKIFWSRGNGWVYGGIIRTLDYLPADDPQREKYLDLFRKMTAKLVKLQGEDGFWRTSLNEPTWMTEPESSGTGFFTFGLLAGINRGYLDRQTYLPAALKGWDALCSVVTAEGGVGFAQPVGAEPKPPTANSFMQFSQGAFLLAGSELFTLESKPSNSSRVAPAP